MNKKPALIAALVGVVVVAVMLLGLITPKASQVRSKQKETEQAAQEQQALEARHAQLLAAQQDAPKDRKRLAKLETQIPPTADLPGLIKMLNHTADKAAVDFASIAPGSPIPTGGVTVVPIQITIKGTFFAVDQYLYILENLARVSKVMDISVTPLDQTISPPQLQVAMTANFFTTDTSAGPGAIPSGAEEQTQVGVPTPTPSPSPTEA
jgi:Tfp pilus assembly protein PilO